MLGRPSEQKFALQKPARPEDRYVTLMEQNFRHVLTAIESMWGYPELNTYFAKLTMNERGSREGFPPEVWDDIRLLWDIHLEIVPHSLP
ncbi:MAG TPA: hypothetical protein VGU61_07245 [Noviherbaspirillum sp.]|jgi:hypothetical protein|uniref:hypothetical protein n=1 Tax=Noviherbaspirillum sp. TaxID=1926288 RepID=UPI002DDD35B3|nr:hypothetical protein [Noviherbaspirillum sp.]HEV2610047.1 hypothetical protein [Noviherbaspirillum sp.]